MTHLAAIDAAGFRARAAEAAEVYGLAMRRSRDVVIQRRDIIAVHVGYPGFVAMGAFESSEPAARLIGFGYGYRGVRGQWWHDIVARALGKQSERWLTNGFELAELHVHPDYHGQGLGRALLTSILAATDAAHALLSTPDLETPARQLYRSYGFVDLRVDFRFPGSSEAYALMGVDL